MDLSEKRDKRINFTPHNYLKRFRLKYNTDSMRQSPLSRSRPRHNEISHSPIKLFTALKISEKARIHSITDLSYKAKLNYSLTVKHIFVLQDGSSVVLGQKINGFQYPLHLIPDFSRQHQAEEMKEFFDHCKNYYKTTENFKFLFSHEGKRLRCLHEIAPNSKIAIVGYQSEFQGIIESDENPQSMRITKSPCYRFLETEETAKFDVPQKINSLFTFNTQKCNKKNTSFPLLKPSPKAIKNPDYVGRLNKFEQLKLKLGNISAKISKQVSPVRAEGLKNLKRRYKFSDIEFHKLYARYKLLVLLSCGVNPSHDMNSGISRQSFVEYYSTSSDLTYILEKVFSQFDSDGGGTISWEEFLDAIHIMRYGTYDDQIDLFFNIYDSSGSGSLSFEDIKALCKVQLQESSQDGFTDGLASSFASLIFDIADTDYKSEIPPEKIKEIVRTSKEKPLIDMFCSFKFLKQ